MNPVHVLVGEDPRAEAMWAKAFGSTVDLYRFPTNVAAFGRVSSAQAPIDLVVLTPAQSGPFNLSAEQFLTRVFESPLASSSVLANLHVIVVGERVARQHPRIASVRTLDAAIRLVKFGEIDTRSMPASVPAPVAAAPRIERQHTNPPGSSVARETTIASGGVSSILDGGHISAGVISRIWDAADRASHVHDNVEVERALETRGPIEGGGPRAGAVREQAARDAGTPALAQGPAQLFTRATSVGFMMATQGRDAAVSNSPHAAVPGVQVGGAPVMAGGPAAKVGAPGESIQVATGQLLPARQYQLAEAGYRGPSTRGGVPQAASHQAMGGQPTPPALASQVHSMIYGGASTHDPLLSWSGNNHGAIVTAGVPVPTAHPAMHAQPQAPMQVAAPAQRVPMVPMQPPASVYGGGAVAMPRAAVAPAMPLATPQFAQAPTLAHDPFLARAEAGGGDVSFG